MVSTAVQTETLEPTEKSLRVARTIRNFVRRHGFSPSLREVADLHGFSSWSSVRQYLDQLRRYGIADWRPGALRSMHLTAKGEQVLQDRFGDDVEEAAT